MSAPANGQVRGCTSQQRLLASPLPLLWTLTVGCPEQGPPLSTTAQGFWPVSTSDRSTNDVPLERPFSEN